MRDREWGPKTEGLALSASIEKESFKSAEAIVLTLVLKNFRPAPFVTVVRSPWADYTYAVHDSHGEELPMTAFGRQRVEAAQEGRKMIRTLHAGEFQSDTFELSRGFEINAPGTYSIIVTRTLPVDGGPSRTLVVQSNVVTFHVTR